MGNTRQQSRFRQIGGRANGALWPPPGHHEAMTWASARQLDPRFELYPPWAEVTPGHPGAGRAARCLPGGALRACERGQIETRPPQLPAARPMAAASSRQASGPPQAGLPRPGSARSGEAVRLPADPPGPRTASPRQCGAQCGAPTAHNAPRRCAAPHPGPTSAVR
jgi:hypothetical protein